MTSIAEGLEKDFPIDESKILQGEFTQWATEGLAIAKAYVYDGKYLSVNLCDLARLHT